MNFENHQYKCAARVGSFSNGNTTRWIITFVKGDKDDDKEQKEKFPLPFQSVASSNKSCMRQGALRRKVKRRQDPPKPATWPRADTQGSRTERQREQQKKQGDKRREERSAFRSAAIHWLKEEVSVSEQARGARVLNRQN